MNGYTPQTWQDHILDGSGNIVQQGTPVSATRLNNIENGIQATYIAQAVTAQYLNAIKGV